jgi:hypothetical protein
MIQYLDIIRLLDEVDLTLATLVKATTTGAARRANSEKNCILVLRVR